MWPVGFLVPTPTLAELECGQENATDKAFGGLVTELLLDRGLGAAGVAISRAQVKGVLRLPPARLRVTFPVLRTRPTRTRPTR
jgi:hypothetical protein